MICEGEIAHPENEDEPILHVGDRLRVTTLAGSEPNEMTLRIIGIAKESGQTMGTSPDSMIIIPVRTSEQFFDSS